MRKLTIGVLAAVMGLAAADQAKFEVASVKKTERCSMRNSADAGSVSYLGDPLRILLMMAFDVKRDQIVGPGWIDDECYEVSAKIPQGASKDQVPGMLRALFEERLKLAAHKDSRTQQIYALVVDKDGPKMKEWTKDSTFMEAHPGQVRLSRQSNPQGGVTGALTMEMLANSLSNNLVYPVKDFTGLTGKYEVDLSWTKMPGIDRGVTAPTGDGAAAEPGASILSVIQTKLGLKLEPRKGEVETVVIDHVERMPIEN